MHTFQINVLMQILATSMCLKYVEDTKFWIKTLIWKVCILLVYVT